jgi:hypothetical protein
VTSQSIILASFWGIIIVANILAILGGRSTDFDSEEELATSPQELIKQIANKTGKAFEINIEAGDSSVNMTTGEGYITMSPQFAYSGERKVLIAFAERIYPTLNKTIGSLGLSISFIRTLKLTSIGVSPLVLTINDSTTAGGLLIMLAAALLLLSICESLLNAARLIRIRENFYKVHEFYPYTSASITYKSLQRGLNQFWWVGSVTRFLGF